MEHEYEARYGDIDRCFEEVNIEETESLEILIRMLRTRVDQREYLEEDSQRLTASLRKKLTSFQIDRNAVFNKIEAIEPLLEEKEEELQKATKKVKKLMKKNSTLEETQRIYELDRKELEEELEEKTDRLNQTAAQRKMLEQEQKQRMAEVKQKTESEMQRRVNETEAEYKRRIQQRDDKMNRLKHILANQNVITTPQVSRGRRRSSMEPFESTPKVDNSNFTQFQPRKPMRSAEKTVKSPTEQNLNSSNEPLSRSDIECSPDRRESSHSRMSRSARRPRRELYNTRNETTAHIVRGRSHSADSRRSKWLSHTPKETVPAGTILQNSVDLVPRYTRSSSGSSLKSLFKKTVKKIVNANTAKRVHVPSMKHLKMADNYMLTHQDTVDGNKLETTILKGNILDTRTDGIQVRFTGEERMTTDNNNISNTSFHSATRLNGSHSFESLPPYRVATRCDKSVVHCQGSSDAHITNANNINGLVQSQTNIQVVRNEDSEDSEA